MTLLVLMGFLSADRVWMAGFKPNTDGRVEGERYSQFVPSGRSVGTKEARAELKELENCTKGNTMHRKAVRYVTGTTSAAAGAVATAATSVAAAAVAASIIFSPVADASSRMEGVSEDLLRAVQLNQITEEQAVKFEAKLAGRILGDA
jgi:hypothetical protein